MSLKSMTGYGQYQDVISGHEILVEVKSVNHRYFEFSSRTSRAYAYLDDKLKSLVALSISRGKVDVSVTIRSNTGNDTVVELNAELARSYVNALRGAKVELDLIDNLSLEFLARLPDVFAVTRVVEDSDTIWNAVKSVAIIAIERFAEMRAIEGEQMALDMKEKLALIEANVARIVELAPIAVNDYKIRLYAKLTELLESRNVDEQRILTEVGIFAEKIATDEEQVRLKSHLSQFYTLLEATEPIGRKLDFLVQEINREVNTIGSKCQLLEITNLVIDTKSLLEKIREQIQNVE